MALSKQEELVDYYKELTVAIRFIRCHQIVHFRFTSSITVDPPEEPSSFLRVIHSPEPLKHIENA